MLPCAPQREHVLEVAKHANGAVVGSAIIAAVESPGQEASSAQRAEAVQKLVTELTGACSFICLFF